MTRILLPTLQKNQCKKKQMEIRFMTNKKFWHACLCKGYVSMNGYARKLFKKGDITVCVIRKDISAICRIWLEQLECIP